MRSRRRFYAGIAFYVAWPAAALLLIVTGTRADAGEQRFNFIWDGRERSYLLFASPAADPATRLPLVIALHGAGQDAGTFANETRFPDAAAAHRMLIVFPDGSGSEAGRLSWNAHFCCGLGVAEQVDDIGFIGALIDHVAARRAVDRKRVYATGMSNGGMLAYQLAAAHPQWFAAIAPVSATIGGTSRQGERFVIAPPGRPVPVMIIHGRKDPYILFDGGSSTMLNYPKRSNMAIADALAFWRAADGCAADPERSEAAAGQLIRTAYGECRGSSEIVLWEIANGEHTWPANVRFPAPDGGTQSAAETILAFFGAHSRK